MQLVEHTIPACKHRDKERDAGEGQCMHDLHPFKLNRIVVYLVGVSLIVVVRLEVSNVEPFKAEQGLDKVHECQHEHVKGCETDDLEQLA